MWYVGPQAIEPSLHGLIVCIFVFTALALVATVLRFYTRALMIKRLGWDDWFMTSTMVFSLLFFGSVFYRKSTLVLSFRRGKRKSPVFHSLARDPDRASQPWPSSHYSGGSINKKPSADRNQIRLGQRREPSHHRSVSCGQSLPTPTCFHPSEGQRRESWRTGWKH